MTSAHRAYTVPFAGDDPDVVAARLVGAGAVGVWLRPDAAVGYFVDATVPDAPPPTGPGPAADHPHGAMLPPAGTWTVEPDRDWATTWREGITAVAAGPFDVVPTWLAARHPPAAGRHRILLDPGRAFGSGHHDTTAGCLAALGDIALAGRRVLDVGTGTGVLAIAAAARGAAHVVAIDLDADAVAVAADNARANRVSLDLVVGSLDDVTGTFDVVVANLLSHTVIALADALVAAVAAGGALVASGVSRERAAPAAAALAANGLTDVVVTPRGDWVVITGHRPGDTGRARP